MTSAWSLPVHLVPRTGPLPVYALRSAVALQVRHQDNLLDLFTEPPPVHFLQVASPLLHLPTQLRLIIHLPFLSHPFLCHPLLLPNLNPCLLTSHLHPSLVSFLQLQTSTSSFLDLPLPPLAQLRSHLLPAIMITMLQSQDLMMAQTFLDPPRLQDFHWRSCHWLPL